PKRAASCASTGLPGCSTCREIWSASATGTPRAAKQAVTVDLPQPLRPVMPTVIIAPPPGTPQPGSGGCTPPSRRRPSGGSGRRPPGPPVRPGRAGCGRYAGPGRPRPLPGRTPRREGGQLCPLAGKAQAGGVLGGVGLHIGFELFKGPFQDGDVRPGSVVLVFHAGAAGHLALGQLFQDGGGQLHFLPQGPLQVLQG